VEDREVSDLIRKLMGRVPIYLFSNTNVLHFEYIRNEFPIINAFRGFFLSYELGIMEPMDGIYEKVISMLGTDPQRTLYIDDRWENLQPARKIGIRVIHHRTAHGLRKDMEQYFPDVG